MTVTFRAAALGGLAATALAACGSSAGGTGAGSSAAKPNGLAFAGCMRSHGVPNFPDPGAGGPLKFGPGSGIDPSSPAFQSAQQACRRLMGGQGGVHPLPESERLRLIANARCMRAHGITNFPDPTFPAGGGVFLRLPARTSLSSPAFQRAAAVCKSPVARALAAAHGG